MFESATALARFDVYPTPLTEERRHTPFWLDVQANHLDTLATRVIVPLRVVSPSIPTKDRLNPAFDVAGKRVYADTANLGTFPLALLRRPVANLRDQRLSIDGALDFLFTGF